MSWTEDEWNGGPAHRMCDNELNEWHTPSLLPFIGLKSYNALTLSWRGQLCLVDPHEPSLPLVSTSAHKGAPASWCSSWKSSHKAHVPVPDLGHTWENMRSKEWKCSFLVLQSGKEAIKIWINLSEMKCRCRTRASRSPWTCTARSLAPVIKDIFMPLKTFSSNVTNTMPVKCSRQPLWGLPSPQLHPLILSECSEGGRLLLGGAMRAWRIIWMKDSELKGKSPNVSALQQILSSSLTLLCSPSTAAWWHWVDRAGEPRKGHTPSTAPSLSPSGFPAVSLKWMVMVVFTSRLFLLLLYSLKDALLTQ